MKVGPYGACVWLLSAPLLQLACGAAGSPDDLPPVRTLPAWAHDCVARSRVSGFSLRDADVDPCFDIAQRDAQEGSVDCVVAVGTDGLVTSVACPDATSPELRSCLESRLADQVLVPYVDCAGRPYAHEWRTGIAWGAEAAPRSDGIGGRMARGWR